MSIVYFFTCNLISVIYPINISATHNARSGTMAQRARFEEVDHNVCALTWTDYLDERVTTTYWAPQHGGYVRVITPNRPGTLGQQVCDALAYSGPTLYWDGRTPLVDAIRREWRKCRARAQREDWI